MKFTPIIPGMTLQKGDQFKCPLTGSWHELPEKDYGRVVYKGSGQYLRPAKKNPRPRPRLKLSATKPAVFVVVGQG